MRSTIATRIVAATPETQALERFAMQIFLDTADLDAITARLPGGLVDGITTNPSLIAQSGADIFERVRAICEAVDGPVSAEVVATDLDGMLAEGRKLRAIADNVVVKLPSTRTGLIACRRLSREGVQTNVTLCFSLNQALAAAKCGATFVSPFVGRLDDTGADGLDLLRKIRKVFDHFGITTDILAASLRSPTHVQQAALIGCDAATLPPRVFDQLLNHPMTDLGLSAFLNDWRKTGRNKL